MTADESLCEEMSELIKSITAAITKKEISPPISFDLHTKRLQLEKLENKKRYFYKKLCLDAHFGTGFENGDEFKAFRRCLPDLALRYKRTITIIVTVGLFLKKYGITKAYKLDTKALTNIVKCYIDDLSVLKKRYGSEMVQLPKIAGLITNLIVKYRPIVPLYAEEHSASSTETNSVSDINEIFAIHHALGICADFSDGAELEAFEVTDQYYEFYADMIYLLNRNYTPECLIMIFKTLCLYQFPSFLNKESDG